MLSSARRLSSSRTAPAAWFAVVLLAVVSTVCLGLGVDAPTASAQTTPPSSPSDPGTTAAPTTAAPTTLPHGDGGVVTVPPKGESTSTAPSTTVPAGPTLPDPSGKVRALLAEIDILNAREAVPKAQQHVTEQQQEAARVGAALDVARARLAVADEAVSTAEQRLADLAISRYVDPGRGSLEMLANGDVNMAEKRSVLLSVSITTERKILLAARHTRSLRAAAERKALRAKQKADANVRKAQSDAANARQRVVDSLQDLKTATANINASGAGSWSLSILGDSAATADEMSYWFLSRGVTPHAQVPITTLTKYFVEEGKDEGVRGDMAFAQSIVETGSFTNPDTIELNNFAGVGHCDTCASGFAFSSALTGVRGQIQLLKSYAVKDPDYKHPLVDKRLHGPAGCCQTWRELTHKWATAPNYGPVILEMYRQLLVFVVQHRHGVIPPGAN